jgi:hypothetical protein
MAESRQSQTRCLAEKIVMKCLTENEISHWLDQHGIVGDPYAKSHAAFYLQFDAPKKHQAIDGFIRRYYDLIVRSTDTLLHITDWGLYTPSEMIPVMGIRSLHSEARLLIEAPGHLLDSAEAETAISLIALTASFAWSSYLYCPTNRSTLYNWEGDVFDFWTDDPSLIAILKGILQDFDLQETAKTAPVKEDNSQAASPGQ